MNSLVGRHLIIDLITVDKSILKCLNHAEEYCNKVTEITDMQLVLPVKALKFPFSTEHIGCINRLNPLIEKIDLEKQPELNILIDTFKEYKYYTDLKEKDDVGVSTLGLWNTSHVATHSWAEVNYISIDMYSCKDFDSLPVINFTREFYKSVRMDIVNIIRHIGKPQVIEQFSILN